MKFWVISLKKFPAKIKILEFETKNVLLVIFRLKIGKNDCDILNQHPGICQNTKNCAKQKQKNQIWDQKYLIWYLGL